MREIHELLDAYVKAEQHAEELYAEIAEIAVALAPAVLRLREWHHARRAQISPGEIVMATAFVRELIETAGVDLAGHPAAVGARLRRLCGVSPS